MADTNGMPRRSLESILTVKSTNMSSSKYSASVPKVQEIDSSEAIVRQLISEKMNLRANIERTFKSNNQKAAVEARQTAARRFNSKGFQSLLTSQKMKSTLSGEGR